MLSINKELQTFSANLPWGKCRNREGVYSYSLSPTTLLRKVYALTFSFNNLNPFRCFADDATSEPRMARHSGAYMSHCPHR